MLSISKLVTMMLLAAGSESRKSSWQKWHSRRLRDVQTTSSNQDLLRSLGLHLDGRALLDHLTLPKDMRQKGLDAIEEHRQVIEKIFDVQKSGADISSLTDALYKVENQAADQYEKLIEAGVISSPRPLRDDELASALRDATGIDPSEDSNVDAELFRIMARHWDHKPPASALGVSAKFHSDGRVEKARYHVALHLPCGNSWDAHRLARSAEAAATLLRAPALVQSWVTMVEKMPPGSIDSLGFGIALLSDGSRAGKIYVTNPGGAPMPHLPVGGDKVLGDVLPTVGESLDANMVSLEWIAGDEKVALRHYAIQRHVSHEQRVLDFAGPGPLSTSILDLMKMASSATETVSYTPHFTQEEVSRTGQAPQVSKTKLGLQLSDQYMGDERFLLLTAPVFKILGIDVKGVQGWVSSSSQLGHTISNIQAGSSYVTLYRHPLHLCSLADRIEKRRRLGNHAKTACQLAQEEFQKHMWGGDCEQSMKWSDDCENCKNMNEGDYNGACYERCLSDWTKPCASNCTNAISAVIDACKGCSETKTWCGKKGSNGLPMSWPNESCQSCKPDESGCYEDDKVCVDWMAENHPSAVFTKPFNDGDMILMVQQPVSGVPYNCKYPILPWMDGKFPMCDTCESANNAMTQMFMWGGPCSYNKACGSDRPDGAMGTQQCAASKGWECGCGCGDVLQKVSQKCSIGEDVCPANIPSACRSDDDDVFNKCDAPPWQGLHMQFLWGEQMATSKCYVNNKFPNECVKDTAYSSEQILTWLKTGEDMQNREALPSDCCDASLQTGQIDSNTSWISKDVSLSTASIPHADHFPLLVMFLVVVGYMQV